MANHVEPGTVAGATQEPGGRTGTTQAAEAGGAVPDTGAAGAMARPAFVGQAPGSPVAPYTPYHGRAVSWVSVSMIMVGFLVGGLALAFGQHGPTWWLFWTGGGLAVLGGLLGLATGITDDWY